MKFVSVVATCLSLIFVFSLCSCQGSPKMPAAKVFSNYNFPPSGGIQDRVFAAPDFILEHFAAYDKDIIPADKPYRGYTPTDAEMKEIVKVIRRLPKKYVDKITPRFLGLFFIENMIGSGWGEWVPGPDGEVYTIIALNPECLKLTASEWLTKKEKSIFIFDDPAYDLHIDIGTDLSGFYYIFNHEVSHAYDYLAQVTPVEPRMVSTMKFLAAKKTQSTL